MSLVGLAFVCGVLRVLTRTSGVAAGVSALLLLETAAARYTLLAVCEETYSMCNICGRQRGGVTMWALWPAMDMWPNQPHVARVHVSCCCADF